MAKDLNAVTPSMGEGSTVYVAVEISDKSWVAGIGLPADPGKVGMHMLAPADKDGLVAKIDQACARAGGSPRVLLTYEAGYEGFWLARWFGENAPQVDVLVCDPASLEVVRKAKRAKTDRIDAKRMVRALRAWDRGEAEALSVVRIPTEEEEDAKRLLRNRERIVTDRTRLSNAIKGLLKLQGIRELEPRHPTFLSDLAEAFTGYDAPLRAGLREEIEMTHERLVLAMAQLDRIEEKKAALIEEAVVPAQQAASDDRDQQADTEEEHAGPAQCTPAMPGAAAVLVRVKGIGPNDALLLHNEVFYRDFRNRREIASWAGLAPVPGPAGRHRGRACRAGAMHTCDAGCGGCAGPGEGYRAERCPAASQRGVLPGLQEPAGDRQLGGSCTGPVGKRRGRERPGHQQGGSTDGPQASGADGVALGAVSARQRDHDVVPSVLRWPAWQARAQAGDHRRGPQAACRAVAVRRNRTGADGCGAQQVVMS